MSAPGAAAGPARQRIGAARRIVVKVGSSSLTSLSGGLDLARLDALVDALMGRRKNGTQIVLVSSGAIAAGLAPLALRRRPRDLATQQAAAAVGQLLLAHAYAASFARYEQGIGQVLLTADDMIRRSHYRNAQRTLERLLGLGCCRWSTRTTRWPPTRSGSATTTGWPRSSRTSSAPTRSSCSPTWRVSTTGTRAAPTPTSCPRWTTRRRRWPMSA